MHTTKEVLAAAGFKTERTIQRWRKRNLLPPPTLQRHPNGRGMTWMWPEWTIPHIAAIKKRLAAGETLTDVAQTLSGDWQAEERKWGRKRYDLARVIQRGYRDHAVDRFAEWASDLVYSYFRDNGVERPGRVDDRIREAVSKPHFVNAVLELIRQGYTPLMVVTKEEVTVAADFLLASTFSNSEVGVQPVLVVPIRDAFLDAFAVAEPDLPKEARFVATMKVVERGEKKTRVRNYRHKDKWKFTLE